MAKDSCENQLRVGVIRSSSIGDVVLASACLDLANSLGVQLVWLGRNPTLHLLHLAHPQASFIEMPNRATSNIIDDTLKKMGRLSALVDLQANLRSHAYVQRARTQKIPVYICPKRRYERLEMIGRARLRGRLFPKPAFERSRSVLQFKTMLDTFTEALKKLHPNPAQVEVTAQLARPNLKALKSRVVDPSWGNDLNFGRWLALAPGAAHRTKECPKSIWIEILLDFKNRFRWESSAGLIVVGGDGDRKIALEILDTVSWPWPVLNMAGKLSLEDTATALSRADALLTNDSGLLHIAEAVGTPVLAIFGPTVEEFGFSPWNPESMIASSNIGCRPCSRHGKKKCRYHDKLCFASIPQHKVTESLERIFINSPGVAK